MDRESIETFLRTTASELAIKILAALAFWIIGRWLIGEVVGLMQAAMNRNDIDPTLTKYLGSIVAIALNVALVLGILGYFGIQTTSLRPTRRVERTMQIAGSVDPLDAMARLRTAIAAIPNVATGPAPEVNLLETDLVGHVIAVRPYCDTDHYWQVYFDT